MNPSINFILGSLACIFVAFAIIVYIWFGRLHRIAFQRKFRLVRKCMIMYGAVLTTSDMISQTSIMLDALISAEIQRKNWQKVYKKILKPFIIFPLFCLAILPIVTTLNVLQSTIHIIFNAMVLWRAYNDLFKVDFVLDNLKPFLIELGNIVQSQIVIEYLFYPIIAVVDVISSFRINLSAIKVTCTGAQSPLYLLCDIAIVGIVIIIIESDVNVFWTVMTSAVSKIRSLVFSRHYFSRNICSSSLYLTTLILITQVPDPSKLVQYCMGFVVITKLFNLDNNIAHVDWVHSSPNCDSTIRYLFNGRDIGFPIDSSSQLDWHISRNRVAGRFGDCSFPEVYQYYLFLIYFIAVVYMVSVVLFARKTATEESPFSPRNWSGRLSTPSMFSMWQFGTTSSRNPAPATPTNIELVDPATPTNVELVDLSSHSPTSPPQIDPIDTDPIDTNDGVNPAQVQVNLGVSFSDYDEQPADEKRTDPSPLTLAVLPRSLEEELGRTNNWNPADRDGLQSLHAAVPRKKFVYMKQLSNGLRIISSFFAVDWILLKIIFNLGNSIFFRQRTFMMNKFMIHTSYRSYDPRRERFDPKTARSAVKVNVDAFKYDDDLKMFRKYAEKAKLCYLPWFDGLVSADNADAIVERLEEDKEWEIVKTTLPSFLEMAKDVRKDLEAIEWLDKWPPWSYNYLCHFFPAQILLTNSGRKNWWRVCQTYFGMFLVCLGIWPSWVVKDFKIVERFEEYTRLQEVIYRQIGDEVFTNIRVKDIFTKIDNNERVAFGQFVASMCTCRIALLQIFPILTLWSMFASAVSATPLVVLSDEMDKKLPPMIVLKPFAEAEAMLREDYKGDPPLIQVWFIGYYLLVNQSRLIQFILSGYLYLMSMSIIFFPTALVQLTPILAFILLHQGLLSSFYVMLLLKKLLFQNVVRKSTDDDIKEGENADTTDDNNNNLTTDERSNFSVSQDDNEAISNFRRRFGSPGISTSDSRNSSSRDRRTPNDSLWLQCNSADSSGHLSLGGPGSISADNSTQSTASRSVRRVHRVPV